MIREEIERQLYLAGIERTDRMMKTMIILAESIKDFHIALGRALSDFCAVSQATDLIRPRMEPERIIKAFKSWPIKKMDKFYIIKDKKKKKPNYKNPTIWDRL